MGFPIWISLFSVLCSPSSLIRSSSYSFSPGRSPVNLISISSYGFNPERRMRFSARSRIFTGLPMSRTKISPPFAWAPACSTNDTASGIVIKYRIISGWVTVTGPPSSICFLKSGMTLPLLPSTLPNRTATNSVFDRSFII